MKTRMMWLALLLNVSSVIAEPVREIAITIDDLPFVGSANNDPKKLQREHDRFMLILQTLVDHHVPATGFIIANSIEKGQWELLEAFRNAGFSLGNHTYSHKCLNNVSGEKYIDDVDKADKKLTDIMTTPKYFRYPYLAESKGAKRDAVHQYLNEHEYIIAPVTIDSKDFKFNSQLFAIPYSQRPQRLEGLKKRYLSYIWTQTIRAEKNKPADAPIKQILLIHSNLLNSHFLGDIIDMYEKNGYKIVSLDQVMGSATSEPVVAPQSPMLQQLLKKSGS